MSNDSSEANRDDALKSLAVARKKLASSDVEGAIRFTKKSISLFDTPTARSLLVELEALQREGGARASSSANGGASEATGSSSGSSGSSARRPAAASSASSSSAREAPGTAASSKPYTAEQAALVKRITKCKVTEYYEILSIDRKAEDVQIKKAYRKLALTLHPDKNGAPGAEDAFKRVSKAFQILSDPQKRSAFDAHGADPDDRSAGMPSFARRGGRGSPFGGRGGQPFGEEVSAEDLFNMFFGGGGGGGFAGNGFSGSPGGIRFQTFGQPQRRRTAAGGQAQAQQPAWVQLLPLIILVLFSLVSFLPSLFFTQPPPDPSYSFERSAFHDLHRQTHTHAKVDYFVNTRQYATHPFFSTLLSANPSRMSFSPTTDDTKSPEYVNQIIETAVTYQDLPEKLSIPRDYLRFEQGVEQSYLQRLQQMCNYEIQHRNERLQQARGFFGVGADWDKVKRIEAEVMQHCSKLRSLGYRV